MTAREALRFSAPSAIAAETADAAHADYACPAAPLLCWDHVAFLTDWAVSLRFIVNNDGGLLLHWLRSHHHRLCHHHWLGLNVSYLHCVRNLVLLM